MTGIAANKARSVVTNGNRPFAYDSPADLSTAQGRRWRDLQQLVIARLGGAPSEHLKALARRYATLVCMLESMEESMLAGTGISHDLYIRCCGQLNRTAVRLGLDAKLDDEDGTLNIDAELRRRGSL